MYTKCVFLVAFVTLVAVHSAPVMDINTLAIGENETMTIEMVNGSLIVKRQAKIDPQTVSPTPIASNATTAAVTPAAELDDVKPLVKRHIVAVNETHMGSNGEEKTELVAKIVETPIEEDEAKTPVKRQINDVTVNAVVLKPTLVVVGDRENTVDVDGEITKKIENATVIIGGEPKEEEVVIVTPIEEESKAPVKRQVSVSDVTVNRVKVLKPTLIVTGDHEDVKPQEEIVESADNSTIAIAEEIIVVEEPIVEQEVVNVKREIAEELIDEQAAEVDDTKEEIIVEEVAKVEETPKEEAVEEVVAVKEVVTTTTAAVVEVETDSICVLEDGTARTNGFHRFENSCTKFYECKDGAQMLETMQCSVGQMFALGSLMEKENGDVYQPGACVVQTKGMACQDH